MAALEWPVLTWNVPLGKVPDGVPESASLTIIELKRRISLGIERTES